MTGGQLYKYTYFQLDIDSERFLADLRHNLSRPVVFDAIMRVRTSTGVRPVEFFGNFYMANTTDTELASLNSDMTIACKFLLQWGLVQYSNGQKEVECQMYAIVPLNIKYFIESLLCRTTLSGDLSSSGV